MKSAILLLSTALAVLACSTVVSPATVESHELSATVNFAKIERGQDIEITVNSEVGAPKALILRPTIGVETLPLKPNGNGVFRAVFHVGQDAPAGLYGVHVFTGDQDAPTGVAKTSFRVGNIVADYLIANYLDKEHPADDLDHYLSDFKAVGGNFLVAHNLIIQSGAFYPSEIASTNVIRRGAANDLVELILDRADKEGFPVLLSVSWDVTKNTPYAERMKEIKAIISELYEMYKQHPSLIGFYSWQEGSGTYYAPFVREFSGYVKSLDRGLLTACAPHIDDPLLAGYLSVIEDLDIMIYQSAVMASYRPDNRKKYPPRRVRDFSSLGAGAKRLQNKITLTHVELFAYMEKLQSKDFVTAAPSDIADQMLSAAAVSDSDGIALFTYHAQIYQPLKKYPQVAKSRDAVADGLKAFQLVTSKVTDVRNPLALYVPYSDFLVERWTNYFLPALDAFRSLGVAVDVLPYAPRLDESVYPYYPIHHNPDVLERLIKERTILVLANVSGFQQTDSDMIKEFVERGGVIVTFGELIPMGRTYERRELFGGEESGEKLHRSIVVKKAFGSRVPGGKGFAFPPVKLPSWKADKAQVVAEFEDGSAALFVNHYGKGLVVTIVSDATLAALRFPDLVRDAFDQELTAENRSGLIDVIGADDNFDTVTKTTEKGFNVAIINHHPQAGRVTLRSTTSDFSCIVENAARISSRTGANFYLNLNVPAHGYTLAECSYTGRRR